MEIDCKQFADDGKIHLSWYVENIKKKNSVNAFTYLVFRLIVKRLKSLILTV